jgi:hypothetical protein
MKKYIKIFFFLFSLTVLVVIAGHAQTPAATVLPDVQTSFNNYNLNALQEKVFVHTDKSAYTAGELLWFKIYDVDGIYHKPLNISKVVYIEVLDHNQNPVLQAKIALKNGTGNGSVFLPVTLVSGNFMLRAYTSWMKNFKRDYYFTKNITIINPLKSPEAPPKAAALNYDVQFFPEGGNLVNGISSVVAFKATDQWGRGVNFHGALLDQKNDTIAKFAPLKFGIGRFEFKPDADNSYHTVININGKVIQERLPQANSNGYVMSLKDDGTNRLQVVVSANQPNGSVYLFAHTRNVIKLAQQADISSGTATFTFDKDNLGDGISHLTVFNNNRQPVCERLYFKRPAQNLVINAATDQPAYMTRKKVSIDIDATDQNNVPVAANLSLSVFRLDSLQGMSHEDIQNYLWLSSDLRGNIESPDYYFKNDDKETAEAADNLMLTQGWRRFDWNEVLKNKTPAFEFLPEYYGPVITGQITDQVTSKPAKGMIVYLGIPGKRVQLATAKSDSLGHLIFNMKDFYGPGEVVAETNTQLDTGYHIDIASPFSDQYADASLPDLAISPGVEATLQDHSLAMQVQNIYSGNKLRQFYEPLVDSSAFYGTPNKTYLLDNYVRFTTIEEIMREYVSEVNIANTKGYFHIKVLGGGYNGFLSDADAMVLIDGIPFFNMNKVFVADPLKLYKLDVVPYTYYWGPSVEGGIFAFTSYKGDLGGNEIDPHAVVLDYEGLELQRQFYSPVYDSDQAYDSRVPDFRNVLYWEPNVITTAKGKSSLSFYTSDETGNYLGVLQGLTDNGQAGCKYFMFSVK